MSDRRVWLVTLVVALGFIWACAPKYTSKIEEPEPRVSETSQEIRALIDEAESAYEKGVEFFVQEKSDSAVVYLEGAISLLSSNVDWSQDDLVLTERRLLIYKCRYFLERIPGDWVMRPPREEVADIEPLKPPLPAVEVLLNSRVQRWIDYFTGDGRSTLVRWVQRSGKYREITLRILKEEGLPLNLVNLALIESGFNPKAYSRAHAVGMWQFIASTGRIYGLRIDWWVDERKDPVRSTRAAARHLRDLYEALDSWPLALAAYNSGQRNVERAIRRAGSRDYWDLRLKRETSNYVPKFMAACLIMADPETYGFQFTLDPPLEYDEIEVEPKTDLGVMARCCEVSSSVLEELNPHILQGCAPDGKSGYPVRIPRGKLESCRVELAKVDRDERIADVTELTLVKHRVATGETLSEIAGLYNTSMREIARASGISNYNRIRAGQVLIVPASGYRGHPENPGIHTVRRNETLSSIAARYGLGISDLVRWNGLRSPHLIYAGQQLIVSAGKVPASETLVHKVATGETLSSIASRYRRSLQEILEANAMASEDIIYPGQEIRVPGVSPEVSGDQVFVHKVRKGETISEIAKKYGVPTSTLLAANELDSRGMIYPGDDLLVPVSPGEPLKRNMIIHEVQEGETIYSIARRYAASWKDVLRANDLEAEDPIYPGQQIAVAADRSVTPGVLTHKVRRGENITTISRKYGVSVSSVLQINGLGPRDTIYPGQELKVPAQD
jgi:membrane-bound lytic murein transglycosylase D